MKKAEVLISGSNGVYLIKVLGRATFECTPPLRSLAKTLETETFTKLYIDMKECTGMDSTFMGILAMLGLRSRKISAQMFMLSCSDSNLGLLNGLGLKKLFSFAKESDLPPEILKWTLSGAAPEVPPVPVAADADKITNAKTVLEAHQTLMNVDQGNVKKFEKVVDMVQKDIEKMEDPGKK